MPVLSAAAYYALSLPRLVRGFERPLRTTVAVLGLARFPIEVRVRGRALRFTVRDPLDLWILKETCIDDCYVPADVWPQPDWAVIDIGAGIGDFAVMIASRCPRGIVHAYEPMAESFSLLCDNVALNGIRNVVSHREAVASRRGHLTLRLPEGRPAALARFVEGGPGVARAPARDLASVLDALPGSGCDLMKVDCEGSEFDVLMGAEPGLLRRIRRISLEVHEGFTRYRGADLAEHLASHGYRVRLRRNPVHRHLGHLYAERDGPAKP